MPRKLFWIHAPCSSERPKTQVFEPLEKIHKVNSFRISSLRQ